MDTLLHSKAKTLKIINWKEQWQQQSNDKIFRHFSILVSSKSEESALQTADDL